MEWFDLKEEQIFRYIISLLSLLLFGLLVCVFVLFQSEISRFLERKFFDFELPSYHKMENQPLTEYMYSQRDEGEVEIWECGQRGSVLWLK